MPQLHAPGPTYEESEHVFFPLAHTETHVQHVLMDTHRAAQINTDRNTGHSCSNKQHGVPLAMHNEPLLQSRLPLQLIRSISGKYIHIYYADSSSDRAQTFKCPVFGLWILDISCCWYLDTSCSRCCSRPLADKLTNPKHTDTHRHRHTHTCLCWDPDLLVSSVLGLDPLISSVTFPLVITHHTHTHIWLPKPLS